jgi:hypothetical protein
MSVRAQIRAFLADPASFGTGAVDAQLWLTALSDIVEPMIAAANDHPLRPAQAAAWRGLAPVRSGLVLGPPGTGKTHLLAWQILGYVLARRAAGLPARVFVTAFTLNAIGNLLDAVATRAAVHCPGAVPIRFFGRAPGAGLSNLVLHRDRLDGRNGAEALAELSEEAVIVGGSIWSLYRLLERSDVPGKDGFTAQLFDMVCIDEASQLVLGQGLMALGGLKQGGRLVVAGDDRQLPPVRASREVSLDGKKLGGSLYSFLKSGRAPEFPLDETFRLNGPLVTFPKTAFYDDNYHAVMPDKRLALREDWREGLAPWEVLALDPEYPIAVLLHDGPPAASQNPFEARLAADLACKLADRMAGANEGDGYATDLWTERLAIISPHRAQNALVRRELSEPLRAGAFVETVDRIQGKERDAVVLSYCVADAEFAVAEAAFIFSRERLNVAITRARCKLIVLVSRRLLDAVPSDQEVMDNAELLREFVFNCQRANAEPLMLSAPGGGEVRVDLRLSGFAPAPALADLSAGKTAPAPVQLTQALEQMLIAIRTLALRSPYGTAADFDLRPLIVPQRDPMADLATLFRLGLIGLIPRSGPRGVFWVARPLDPPVRIYDAHIATVRSRLEAVIRETRRGRFKPRYDQVRNRFAWMNERGEDVLMPVLDRLKDDGLIVYDTFNGQLTIDWVDPTPLADDHLAPPPPPLDNQDFLILNALEDTEARRINFGVFEAWTSASSLADGSVWSRPEVEAAFGRLAANGWLMLAAEGRVRSRMAELAREVRYVKQRFRQDDAGNRPYLVRSLKIELRDRDKPERETHRVDAVLSDLAKGAALARAQSAAGLKGALLELWNADACFAGFQARSLASIVDAWDSGGEESFVIAADTGSGKTEAAALPLILAATADRLQGIEGVRAILTYPRIRLATNQAQRLAGYLAALARQPGMPTLTLGVQISQTPGNLDKLNDREMAAGWKAIGSGAFDFPFFACPTCSGRLFLRHQGGEAGADRLSCTHCDWSFGGWIGSKAGLRATPPTLFVPTTDSLHQWLHDVRYGPLFGDGPTPPPRAVLADEIHLYSHIHGAQVGLALRRLLARAALNGAPMMAIGMSATLGDPAVAWSRLIGRSDVATLIPDSKEKLINPRGREYFYFVQPEVESRGKDIAGASTTIQTLMCLGHGMRRRTGAQGGFRELVFLDSIDKVRRLHAAYDDAEMVKRLAAYRTTDYPDDPSTGQPRKGCCGQPHGCDAFRDGECWYFAATDTDQRGARGRRRPGDPLRVAPEPVSSQTSGRVEDLIKDSDVLFATSSLEVGYDDPDISLVYQHYAPRNLASFIQRKGRGGRGADDRPVTGVTLSIYSSRDSWWFRKPHEMLAPGGFETPLNAENHFVRRGQLLAATLDAFARWETTHTPIDPRDVPAAAFAQAEQLAERALGPAPWLAFDVDSLAQLWGRAMASVRSEAPRRLRQVREAIDWIPGALFETINLPQVEVHAADGRRREDIAQALSTAAPGNPTRRYDSVQVAWRPPVQGRGIWLDIEDYAQGRVLPLLGGDATALLRHLPQEARPLLNGVAAEYFRPLTLRMSRLGQAHGTSWQSDWVLTMPAGASDPVVEVSTNASLSAERVRHDSRGELMGFPLVRAKPEQGRVLPADALSPWVRQIHAFLGDGLGGKDTGLALARLYWGGDAEVKTEGPPGEVAVFSQIFTTPDRKRPLLHGYHVQTEGIRIVLDSARIDRFIAAEVERLNADPAARRWHAGQMLRFLIESGARSAGVNGYEAYRAAELMVSAAGDPELNRDLRHLLRFWDKDGPLKLFENTRAKLLSQHPLLSRGRVVKVAAAFSGLAFQALFKSATVAISDPIQFAGYLRSALLHALAGRLKESFLQLGRGDERQVIAHVKLPVQFLADAEDVIILCEAGAYGDGTTRAYIDRFDEAVAHWRSGFIGDCPNAREDAVLRRLLDQPGYHVTWRALDANDPAALSTLAQPLGLPEGAAPPATVLRILFGTESVGSERFDLYDLAMAIEAVDQKLSASLGRAPSAWEVTSAAVEAARDDPGGAPGRLLAAYGAIEDAAQDDSLSPEGRLADQLYRLHARLCVDGCQACVHLPGDLMSEGLVEASTSRRLLARFVCET